MMGIVIERRLCFFNIESTTEETQKNIGTYKSYRSFWVSSIRSASAVYKLELQTVHMSLFQSLVYSGYAVRFVGEVTEILFL